MSARALAAAADLTHRQWSTQADRVIARWVLTIAARPNPREAEAVARGMLMREARNAQMLGVAHARLMEAAAGIDAPATPSPERLTDVRPPRRLYRAIEKDWDAAAGMPDATRARAARAARMLDTHLSDAWRSGLTDAMGADERVRGYRRVANARACGACLALMDGRVLSTRSPFRAHPHCRCYAEPAVAGVNLTSWDRPTGEEHFRSLPRSEQDALFTGRGGEEKAELLRSGAANMSDLVSGARGSMGGTQMVTETPLKALAA